MSKVIKIGNSLGLTINKEDAEALDLKQGDEVMVRRRGSILEVVPVVMRPKLRPDVQKALDQTVDKFGPALDRLSK
ncbi:MAG TPA: hypothetical protein DD435_01245 [Cyanobacteria bacterium UBA8530]|nr:hypothetical protein [Cyanobacteria bacterium UBA8530]